MDYDVLHCSHGSKLVLVHCYRPTDRTHGITVVYVQQPVFRIRYIYTFE